MRNILPYFLILLFLLSNCTIDNETELSDANNVQGFEILDDALIAIQKVWALLPAKSVTLKDKIVFEVYLFLRIKKSNCDLCSVNLISYLNEFLTYSKINKPVILIIDWMDEKEKSNFISGFNLDLIKVEMINTKYSILDEMTEGAYFGVSKNNLITDALPANQLLSKEFILSFINKNK